MKNSPLMFVNVPSAAKWREYATASPRFQAATLVLDDAADGGFVRGRLRAERGGQQRDGKADEKLHASLR